MPSDRVTPEEPKTGKNDDDNKKKNRKSKKNESGASTSAKTDETSQKVSQVHGSEKSQVVQKSKTDKDEGLEKNLQRGQTLKDIESKTAFEIPEVPLKNVGQSTGLKTSKPSTKTTVEIREVHKENVGQTGVKTSKSTPKTTVEIREEALPENIGQSTEAKTSRSSPKTTVEIREEALPENIGQSTEVKTSRSSPKTTVEIREEPEKVGQSKGVKSIRPQVLETGQETNDDDYVMLQVGSRVRTEQNDVSEDEDNYALLANPNRRDESSEEYPTHVLFTPRRAREIQQARLERALRLNAQTRRDPLYSFLSYRYPSVFVALFGIIFGLVAYIIYLKWVKYH